MRRDNCRYKQKSADGDSYHMELYIISKACLHVVCTLNEWRRVTVQEELYSFFTVAC